MKTLRYAAIVVAGVFLFSSSSFSAEKKVATVYTSGVGGTAYIVGGAMAKVVNKYVPEVQMVVEATGGTIASVRFIADKYEKGQEAFGVSDSQGLYQAYKGMKPFEKKYDMIRSVTFVYASGINLVVPKNSPIKTYADLKGKRVAIGPAGSGLATMSVDLIAEHGLKKDQYKYSYLGFKEVPEGIQDGSIDAGFVAGSYPVPALVELSMQKELRIIPVDQKVFKKVLAESPFFGEYTLKPGAYKGVEAATPIMTFGIILETHSKGDPELIYKITKALFEHRDELIEINPVMKEMTLQNVKSTVAFPLHPGAEKYFKEKGAVK